MYMRGFSSNCGASTDGAPRVGDPNSMAMGTRGISRAPNGFSPDREDVPRRVAACARTGLSQAGDREAIMQRRQTMSGGCDAQFEALEGRCLMSMSSFYVQTNLVSDN